MNVHSFQKGMEDISHKKKQIFESTLKLIMEKGFHGAPMSQIAKDANVAAGTIYLYFDNKDHLISELYSHYRNIVVAIVKDVLREQGTYKETFFRIWRAMDQYYRENPKVLIFFEQYVNSPYKASRQEDNYAEYPLYQFFDEGIRNGRLKRMRPEILLILLLSSIIASAKLRSFGKTKVPEEELEDIIQVLWDGIKSPENQ